MRQDDIFLEWLATYGEGEDEMKAGMWNAEMMIEFAQFYHNSMKIIDLDSADRDVVIIGTDHRGNKFDIIERVEKNHKVLVIGYTGMGTTTIAESIAKDLSFKITERPTLKEIHYPTLAEIHYPTVADLNPLPQKQKHKRKLPFHD